MVTQKPAIKGSPSPAARSAAKRLPLASPPLNKGNVRGMAISGLTVGDIGHWGFLTEILQHAILLPLMAALDKRLSAELAWH